MGIFDFFKKKKELKVISNTGKDIRISKKVDYSDIEKITKKKSIKYVSTNEVSLIIKPKISEKNIITFYDLKGNRVSKIPVLKRDLSVELKCYLGLKQYKNVERWELVKSSDVNSQINNKNFIQIHSSKSIGENNSEIKKKSSINEKKSENKSKPINRIPIGNSETIKEINFSFGGEFYKRSYYRDGPETYTIKNKTNIIQRSPTHHSKEFTTSNFSKQYEYDVEGFEVVLTKPISLVKSKGYWLGRDESGSFYEFKCPFDYNLTDEENMIKITSFCDTLNSILKYGSLEKYLNHLNLSKNKIFNKFLIKYDSKNNGIIDVTESNDLMKLIEKNNDLIIESSKNDNKPYIQSFVKLNNFLNNKERSIQLYFDYVKSNKIQNLLEFDYSIQILEKQIKSYNLILFNSLGMVNSLCNGNMIIFYQIYECLDQLNVWNTNWENEMNNELKNINKNFDILTKKIDSLEQNIIEGFSNLNKTISGGFNELQHSIVKELKVINSNVDYGNLFSAISSYQLYKLNKKN